jgi:hypothetical protein
MVIVESNAFAESFVSDSHGEWPALGKIITAYIMRVLSLKIAKYVRSEARMGNGNDHGASWFCEVRQVVNGRQKFFALSDRH